MAQIPKESVEKVLEATDIVDLIGSYIQVKKAGSQFKALCPFHSEKSPSFTITPHRQYFHCFGCAKGGNAISFVMEYENLPFVESVKKLASRAGIHILEESTDPNAEKAGRSQGRLKDIHREVAAFMHEQLMKNPAAQHARDYMKSRGFGSAMAASWSIGWMPENPKLFLDWARSRKFTGRELLDSGIAKLQQDDDPGSGLYVRFQDRLMFPIRNEIGDVIAFSGRQLRENKNSGKYINSPETPIFKKSRVFFGLDRAKKPILKEKAALLCEGQIDAICCHELGIEHAIATCGTACTREHAKLLRRYTHDVLICFDADKAGLAATEKAYRELVPEGLSVRVVEMPAGDDPDSYLKAHGEQAFRQLLANAKEFFDFKLERGKAIGLFNTAAERTIALNECAEMLSLMTDFAARENQINIVATHLQTSSVALREAIAKAKLNPKKSYTDRTEVLLGQESHLEPTVLHSIVADLCYLALTSGPAQHFLSEQFETLHEANRWIQGIPLLENILSVAPDPATPAAVNAFLATLGRADQLAIASEISKVREISVDGLRYAEDVLGLLSVTVLQRRVISLKAEGKQSALSPKRMMEIMQETVELQSILQGSGQRHEIDDEFSPSTAKPKDAGGMKWKNRYIKPG